MTQINRSYEINCHPAFGGKTEFGSNYIGQLYGAEIELFTRNSISGVIVPGRRYGVIVPVPDYLYAAQHLEELVKPELSSCQFEISPKPTKSLLELYDELKTDVAKTRKCLEEQTQGYSEKIDMFPLAYAGKSDDSQDGAITGISNTSHRPGFSARYRMLADLFGQQFVENAARVASDQINIGASTETEAFSIFNLLRTYLPIIAGFSVASPFDANGNFSRSRIDTNPQSQRLIAYKNAVASVSGKDIGFSGLVPPEMNSLEDYVRAVEQLAYPHPNVLYHLIRPMPHRGVAAEIRVIDKQPSLADTMAVFALVKGFVQSGIPSKANDEQLAEGIEKAVYGGIYDVDLFEHALKLAESALPEDEKPLLAPLETRLKHGSIAENLHVISIEEDQATAKCALMSSFYQDMPFTEYRLEQSEQLRKPDFFIAQGKYYYIDGF